MTQHQRVEDQDANRFIFIDSILPLMSAFITVFIHHYHKHIYTIKIMHATTTCSTYGNKMFTSHNMYRKVVRQSAESCNSTDRWYEYL